MSTDEYQGVGSMIDKITNNRNPYEMTDQQERLQKQQDDAREKGVESLLDEMKGDADIITDAILADNELANDIAEILAGLFNSVNGLSDNGGAASRVVSMLAIETKLHAALLDMAVKENEDV